MPATPRTGDTTAIASPDRISQTRETRQCNRDQRELRDQARQQQPHTCHSESPQEAFNDERTGRTRLRQTDPETGRAQEVGRCGGQMLGRRSNNCGKQTQRLISHCSLPPSRRCVVMKVAQVYQAERGLNRVGAGLKSAPTPLCITGRLCITRRQRTTTAPL